MWGGIRLMDTTDLWYHFFAALRPNPDCTITQPLKASLILNTDHSNSCINKPVKYLTSATGRTDADSSLDPWRR